MRLFNRSKAGSSVHNGIDTKDSLASVNDSSPERNYTHEDGYNNGLSGEKFVGNDGEVYDGDLLVPCPAHTTEAKLMRKIDARVIPVLCILYLLAFLDRVNISNARSFGLEADLNMDPTSLDFNTAVVAFFPTYILLEIPSNILLKRFRPHVWLSFCMFFFGLITVCQGLTRSYGGLITTRVLLGAFEAGMFPGCFYLISMWYRRAEAQKRYSFFFSSTTLAGAFGGLLAAAIGKMDGIRGYRGWRWIFILEGLLTCVVSLVFFFIMSDFPEDAKWLKPDERAYVKARLQVDQGKSAIDRKITLRDIVNVFKDPKIVVGGFMYFGLIVPAYGYAYFSTSIITTYGYSPIQTQLHSVTPWAAAFGFSMLIAWLSDRLRHRFLFAIIPIAISITGFGMLLGLYNHIDPSYGALHLITSGTYTAMPIIVCWFTMNLGGHHRRAVGTGWQIGFGNIGGIIAAFSFRTKDSPRFVKGYSICIAFSILSALSCLLYLFLVTRENRNRKKMPVDLNLTEEQKAEKGDLNPAYRYQL